MKIWTHCPVSCWLAAQDLGHLHRWLASQAFRRCWTRWAGTASFELAHACLGWRPSSSCPRCVSRTRARPVNGAMRRVDLRRIHHPQPPQLPGCSMANHQPPRSPRQSESRLDRGVVVWSHMQHSNSHTRLSIPTIPSERAAECCIYKLWPPSLLVYVLRTFVVSIKHHEY